MTTKSEKKDNAATDGADAVTTNEKANKVAEKLKTMGVMPSDKDIPEVEVDKVPEVEARKHSTLMITLSVAVLVAGFIAYMNSPDQFNQLSSSVSNLFVTTPDQPDPVDANNQHQPPGYQANSNWDSSDTLAWSRPQEPEWVTQQRTDMEQRRAEYQKQNADRYASSRATSQSPDQPQWVKDRRAQMQQEMTKYQQQRTNPANWPYGKAPEMPEYMKHPRMNSYPPNNSRADNQMQAQPNQNAVNNYPQQTQRQYYSGYNYPAQPYNYYNAPFYGYSSNNNVPYSAYGYAYR